MLSTKSCDAAYFLVSHLDSCVRPTHQRLAEEIEAVSDVPHGMLMVVVNRGICSPDRPGAMVFRETRTCLIECLTEHIEAMQLVKHSHAAFLGRERGMSEESASFGEK